MIYKECHIGCATVSNNSNGVDLSKNAAQRNKWMLSFSVGCVSVKLGSLELDIFV